MALRVDGSAPSVIAMRRNAMWPSRRGEVCGGRVSLPRNDDSPSSLRPMTREIARQR